MTINSLASRIQIGKFTSENVTVGSPATTIAITGYTLEGIYINNVNPAMTVSSTFPIANPIVDNGSTPSNYVTTTGSAYFATTGSLAGLADEPARATTTGVVTPATSTNVWAYNVFPQSSAPHIIVKISDIDYTINGVAQSTITADKWLTIDSYKKAGATPVELVSSFVANNIYTLSDIKFNFNDLTDTPYTTTVDVNVEVEMFKWEEHQLEWDN